MDREWLYKQLSDLSKLVDVQTSLFESLTDRVASLEECARVTPTSRRASRKTQKEDAPCV